MVESVTVGGGVLGGGCWEDLASIVNSRGRRTQGSGGCESGALL